MMPKFRFGLLVTGHDIDFEAVSSFLGVQPTDRWKRGTVPRPGAHPREYDAWWYRLPPVFAYYLEERVAALAQALPVDPVAFGAFCRERGYEVQVGGSVWFADETPSVHLNLENVSWMHALGAELDLDIYTLEPEDFEEKFGPNVPGGWGAIGGPQEA